MIATINYPGGKGTEYEEFRYPGGEVQVRLTSGSVALLTSQEVRKIHVIARITDGEVMALAQLIDAIKSVTEDPLVLILPYLPYGRADRRFTTGDCTGLGVFGKMLAMMVTEVVTLDAHSPAAMRYVRYLTDVSPQPIIQQVIDKIDGTYVYGTPVLNTAVLLPDKGSLRYGFPTDLVCDKVRDALTGKLLGFQVPTKEKFEQADNILIIDDICDGGGTFIGIADAIRAAGVEQPLYLYVTHGIFSKGTGELRKRFENIYTTDSFNSALYPPGVTVIPCMPTINKGII